MKHKLRRKNIFKKNVSSIYKTCHCVRDDQTLDSWSMVTAKMILTETSRKEEFYTTVLKEVEKKTKHHVGLKFLFQPEWTDQPTAGTLGLVHKVRLIISVAVREFSVPGSEEPSWSYYDNWNVSTSDSTNGVRIQWSRAKIQPYKSKFTRLRRRN